MTAQQVQEAFRSHLAPLRKAHGWTQWEMAERLTAAGWPMSRVTWAQVEGQNRGVSLGEAVVVAKVFGVDLALLVSPEPILVEVSV